MFCNTSPETVGIVKHGYSCRAQGAKAPLKLVFEFAQNLSTKSLRWMIAPSARFQESSKSPLPSTELRAKTKA